MTITQILETLRSVISNEFRVPADRIDATTTAADVDGWDSFSNGLLLMALEDRFGLTLPVEDLVGARNVGEMATVIARIKA